MLSKLIKYEWRSFWKIPAFVNLFLFIFTLFGIFVLRAQIWEIDNPFIQAMGMFVLMSYYISIIVISFVTTIYTAVRFYKNMYTDEGYLMHTLPVKQKALIFSKLVVSYVWTIITALVIIFSVVCLIFAAATASGADMMSFFDSVGDILITLLEIMTSPEFKETLGISFVPFVVILVLDCILGPLSSILTIYAAISLGQLFQKHKVFGSIISYIGIYTVLQIVNYIVQAPLMFSTALNASFTSFGPLMYFSLGETILFSVGFFFLTEWIMKKKLNLD